MTSIFKDRREAGKALAQSLARYANRPDVLVLGLPRGGVPVAFEVARLLHAPLDVVVARKLGLPGHEEFAMGAIASGGFRALNPETLGWLRIPREVIEEVATREEAELHRRERAYRGDRPAPVIEGKTVILVDDGIATGATMRAAARATRAQAPARLLIAVPVAPADTESDFAGEADELIALATPSDFQAVGEAYADFGQTTDAEVVRLLREATPPATEG